jgi:hypothetical protein
MVYGKGNALLTTKPHIQIPSSNLMRQTTRLHRNHITGTFIPDNTRQSGTSYESLKRKVDNISERITAPVSSHIAKQDPECGQILRNPHESFITFNKLSGIYNLMGTCMVSCDQI